ncbi:hypothetical protein HYN24_10170 [Dechloromonas sp. HYN0024]|nr:hypothetical protein HYN24_10170 [Dechloromonas sp. HYN0024]
MQSWSGNDIIYGNSGDDVLKGGAGDDYIDGGLGIDQSVYSANSSSVSLVRHLKAGGVLLESAEGSDTLVNVEQVQFNDGTFNLESFIRSIPTPSYTTDAGNATPTVYSGAVGFLEFQFLGGAVGEIVIGSKYNDFINLLAGDDAADGAGGDDVLDGGIGSNFLTGGAGKDTFFLDGRGGSVTWSTITDFEAGDQVNIWGWQPNVSKLLLTQASAGASGFSGATYHYDLNNDGSIDTSITFAVLALSAVPSPVPSDVAGNGYLLFG